VAGGHRGVSTERGAEPKPAGRRRGGCASVPRLTSGVGCSNEAIANRHPQLRGQATGGGLGSVEVRHSG